MTEATLTKKFLDNARLFYTGLYALKLNLLTAAGVPDAFLAFEGRACFIEFKKDDYQQTTLQKLVARQIEAAGIPVWIVRFRQDVTTVSRLIHGRDVVSLASTVSHTIIERIVEAQ